MGQIHEVVLIQCGYKYSDLVTLFFSSETGRGRGIPSFYGHFQLLGLVQFETSILNCLLLLMTINNFFSSLSRARYETLVSWSRGHCIYIIRSTKDGQVIRFIKAPCILNLTGKFYQGQSTLRHKLLFQGLLLPPLFGLICLLMV